MSKRGENIYKRKDGRWEGRYIKCRTLHGRIQYGYVYGKRYSEVKSKLKETASRPIQTSDSRAPQPTSYSEILKMWLLSAKNHVKESTFSRYNHLVERHIQPFSSAGGWTEVEGFRQRVCRIFWLSLRDPCAMRKKIIIS